MTTLLLLPLMGAVTLIFVPSKKWALSISMLTLLESISIFLALDKKSSDFQYVIKYVWWNKEMAFGIDGMSINYVLLTTMLIPMCMMVSWESVKHLTSQYYMSLLVIEWLLISVFTVLDVLGFYVFYEGVLMPMFYMMGVWGASEQKMTAAYYFFFYTLLGSVLMLVSMMYMYTMTGTTDYPTLLAYELTEKVQKVVFMGFMASLAVKIPSFPFHMWLPLAHVEAPVAGSVLLAGVLMKLGSYGLMSYTLGLTPMACEYFAPLVYTLSMLGVIYASMTTMRQTDLKSMMAYSSVGHMGMVTMGMFTMNLEGIQGSMFLQLAHGMVSSALFMVVTLLYESYHTSMVKYYSGVTVTMPIYSTLFLMFTMGNIGVPGTSNYVGEMLALTGAMEENKVVTMLAALGMVLSASYGLFLYNSVSFGGLSSYMLTAPSDVTSSEYKILMPLAMLSMVLGMWPAMVLETVEASVQILVK